MLTSAFQALFIKLYMVTHVQHVAEQKIFLGSRVVPKQDECKYSDKMFQQI